MGKYRDILLEKKLYTDIIFGFFMEQISFLKIFLYLQRYTAGREKATNSY